MRAPDVHDLEIGNVNNLPARPTYAQAPIGLALEGVEVLVEHPDIFNHLCPHHEKVAVQPANRFPGGDRFIDAVVPESGREYDVGDFRSHAVHQGRGLLIAAVRVDGSASGDPYVGMRVHETHHAVDGTGTQHGVVVQQQGIAAGAPRHQLIVGAAIAELHRRPQLFHPGKVGCEHPRVIALAREIKADDHP